MNTHNDRLAVADLAARYMLEQGLRDYKQAKLKACQALNLQVNPSNAEITQCMAERQRLFSDANADDQLESALTVAQQCAQLLNQFNPSLADNLLDSHIGSNEAITIHCSADHPDEVAMLLMSSGIDYRIHDKLFRFSNQQTATRPVIQCHADGFDVNLVIFTRQEWSNKPVSPRTGEVMQRRKLLKQQK